MLAWYQHVSGISFPVLEQHPFNLDYINSLWLNDFVRLQKKYKVELKFRSQYITSVISSMDYNKTWPVSLRYGDHKYYGLQLKHLETEALIRKISHLRLLLFKPYTSQLVLVMLAWYQNVSGISFPVLKQHSFNLDYINSL